MPCPPYLIHFVQETGGLTPGITRRPERLPKMRVFVSAVGCMPLLGGGPATRADGKFMPLIPAVA